MDDNYRSAVGPADRYDLIGGQQFCVLLNQGLREHHKLCDVGCGSLRGGRLFIPYLAKGNYYGIEPDIALVKAGFEKEIGLDMAHVKDPHFLYNDDFLLTKFGVRFDFILAQSIVSHTSQSQMIRLFAQVRATLAPGGKFLFTYFKSDRDYKGDLWTRLPSAFYTKVLVKKNLGLATLSYIELDYKHPSNQTWILSQRA